MLHTKAQGHWPFGSWEEDFWRVFTIYGHGGHPGHVTQTSRTNFHSPIPLRLHMKFRFNWLSGFGEENGGRTDNGRTDNRPWLYYKLTNEPKGSGELKNQFVLLFIWYGITEILCLVWETEFDKTGLMIPLYKHTEICYILMIPIVQADMSGQTV